MSTADPSDTLSDEVVVQGETAERQVEERSPLVALDVRRQDSRRRLRRASRNRPRLKEAHPSPPRGKLPRNRTPDDPPTDDDDVRAPAHLVDHTGGDTQPGHSTLSVPGGDDGKPIASSSSFSEV